MDINILTRNMCIKDVIVALTDCINIGNETECFTVPEVLYFESIIDELETIKDAFPTLSET